MKAKGVRLHPLEREFQRVQRNLDREHERHKKAHGCTPRYVRDEWGLASSVLGRQAMSTTERCYVEVALLHAWASAHAMATALAWLLRGEPAKPYAIEWGIDPATNAFPPDPPEMH